MKKLAKLSLLYIFIIFTFQTILHAEVPYFIDFKYILEDKSSCDGKII